MTATLVDRVRARLVGDAVEATPSRVAAALRAEGVILGDDSVLEVSGRLRREMVGAGPLDPLLALPGVTDVLVNGPREVWVDCGEGLARVSVEFSSDDEVRALAQRLAASAGRRLDDARPFVDARLPSGARLHCVLQPVAVGSTLISLRVPNRRGFSVADLTDRGSVDSAGADVLRDIVASRLAFLVSGGTGSGKTTILGAMLSEVPDWERIVVVEDSTELDPEHPHVVRMQARTANTEGAGEVLLRDLVRQALRMRPDRLVVGEVRGSEVVELLSAMNTGHEGGAGTVHANSASDVPARLEALGLLAGLDRQAVHALMGAGLDLVLHLAREDGRRVVSGLHVLTRDPSGLVATLPALEREDGALVERVGMPHLAARLSHA